MWSCGCVWLCVVVCGCVRLCVVMCGCVWLCVVVRGCVWSRLLLSSSHRRLGSVRADAGGAERAPSRERGIVPAERR